MYFFKFQNCVIADWKARVDVALLLGKLKKERTLVIVSHDMRYFSDYYSAKIFLIL